MKNNKKLRTVRLALSLVFVMALFALQAFSTPVGPVINYVSNETAPGVGSGTARTNDEGGYITTLNLNASQQNFAWKAYVGNVTGVLALDDAENYSIYSWVITANKEVYISRNISITWSGINCTNQTEKESEDTFLNLDSTAASSVNQTFNETVHKQFVVAGGTISNSTCYSIATYLNDSAQSSGESNVFQEILLSDTSGRMVYAAIVDEDTAGFDTNIYDFQAIVAEDETAGSPTTYYFYVELA